MMDHMQEKRIQFKRPVRSDLQTQLWLRVFAFTIDTFIIRFFIVPLILVVLSFTPLTLVERPEDLSVEIFQDYLIMNSTILIGLNVVVMILYSAILESSRLQGTLGKWFLRFNVCDLDFNRISFSKALLRNLVKIFSIISVIGIALIDMTPKRQGLHDLIARTVLIRG